MADQNLVCAGPKAQAARARSDSHTKAPVSANSTAVDQDKVGRLVQAVGVDPRDVASLQALGDIYFAAKDYQNAADWEQKALDVESTNKMALIALGAAQFNLGNAAEAKKHWLVAAALYPNEAEVHYDLGFLYSTQNPPDSVNMKAEWKRVVAIDPNSNLAKSVAPHIQ